MIFFIFADCDAVTKQNREKGAYVGMLTTVGHQVSGKVWAIDDQTLFIERFTYDGTGAGELILIFDFYQYFYVLFYILEQKLAI